MQKNIKKIAIVICIALLLCAGYLITKRIIVYKRGKQTFEALADKTGPELKKRLTELATHYIKINKDT